MICSTHCRHFWCCCLKAMHFEFCVIVSTVSKELVRIQTGIYTIFLSFIIVISIPMFSMNKNENIYWIILQCIPKHLDKIKQANIPQITRCQWDYCLQVWLRGNRFSCLVKSLQVCSTKSSRSFKSTISRTTTNEGCKDTRLIG